MSQLIEVKVPDIGDFDAVPVIELFVKVGDTIAVDDAIATLESDKATMDVPSSHAGVVKEILVGIGDKVAEGTVLIKVESATVGAAQAASLSGAPASAAAEQKLAGFEGPIVAATDYIRMFPEQIRSQLDRSFVTLGTDGFGRSDTRENLRHFFEVDRHWVTLAALKALADDGVIGRDKVAAALVKYNLDPNKPNPMSV